MFTEGRMASWMAEAGVDDLTWTEEKADGEKSEAWKRTPRGAE
jgi:hypothetical protein